MNTQTALTTASATGTTGWSGGRGFLAAWGTWGGGVLALTWCATSGGTFTPIGSGVVLNADGSTGFEIGAGYVKATLSGSTGATVNWGVALTGLSQLGT